MAQLIKDITSSRTLIEQSIAKFGSAPEHTYHYFCAQNQEEAKAYFISFGHDRGIGCIVWDDGVWQIIGEILAPHDEQATLFYEFVTIAFAHDAKKIFVEFPPELRKQLLKKLPTFNASHASNNTTTPQILIGNINYHFTTPIIDLSTWDPLLEGSDMSKLRKAKSRFQRNFTVEILKDDACLSIPFSELQQLVASWKKNRKNRDQALCEDYVNYFKEKFPGAVASLGLKLNGKLCGVASAWMVPNHENTVYYGINIHDYSVSELGDYLTVLFLDFLKEKGFQYMDFGSSDEKLLRYKEKFKPSKYYKTICFYTRKKE